ncbi:hypothetical protein B0H14DRAFT_3455927 [Mycena olivaceomarginata]|nr:hypothetical protein B0H14DRAFT_3455927 [Mycena olivaceomarginata]
MVRASYKPFLKPLAWFKCLPRDPPPPPPHVQNFNPEFPLRPAVCPYTRLCRHARSALRPHHGRVPLRKPYAPPLHSYRPTSALPLPPSLRIRMHFAATSAVPCLRTPRPSAPSTCTNAQMAG